MKTISYLDKSSKESISFNKEQLIIASIIGTLSALSYSNIRIVDRDGNVMNDVLLDRNNISVREYEIIGYKYPKRIRIKFTRFFQDYVYQVMTYNPNGFIRNHKEVVWKRRGGLYDPNVEGRFFTDLKEAIIDIGAYRYFEL
jgi:hypothetical protein